MYCNPPDFDDRVAEVAEHQDAVAAGERVEEIPSPGHGFIVIRGRNVVFSAPHEEPHTRDGERKVEEGGTASMAVLLAAEVGGSAIYTSGYQLGDPNWDDPHPYADEAVALSSGGCLIDLHIMRNRGVEVCLGLGRNHEMSRKLWAPVLDELLDADVRVSINWPFGGRGRPITSRAQQVGVPALQIEMVPEVFDPTKREHVCVTSALRRASKRLWCL